MNEFEKVEKLRQRANVSYEEAREALKEANGDLLDAMVLLEQQGKVAGPEQTVYSTTNDGGNFADVSAFVKESEKKAEQETGFFKKIGRLFHKAWRYTSENFVQIERKNEVIMKVPLWIAILALVAFWEFLLVLILISLFCGCTYRVIGADKNEEVNKAMAQASKFTEQVKDEFNKI